MRIFITSLLVLLPLAASAQSYSNAPLLVVGGSQQQVAAPAPTAAPTAAAIPATTPNFPAAAVTQIGQIVGGEKTDIPATPTSPVPPANPASGATAPTPASPASPVSPVNPVSKLWPRDTVPIFMTSCVGFSPIKIPPCSCVITKLMLTMPHDQFLAKSENGTIEQDANLQRIRMDCTTAPQKKD